MLKTITAFTFCLFAFGITHAQTNDANVTHQIALGTLKQISYISSSNFQVEDLARENKTDFPLPIYGFKELDFPIRGVSGEGVETTSSLVSVSEKAMSQVFTDIDEKTNFVMQVWNEMLNEYSRENESFKNEVDFPVQDCNSKYVNFSSIDK